MVEWFSDRIHLNTTKVRDLPSFPIAIRSSFIKQMVAMRI
jgi:hypothetical protein